MIKQIVQWKITSFWFMKSSTVLLFQWLPPFSCQHFTWIVNLCTIYVSVFIFFIFFSFIYISWRLITLQYCSGFCHTLIWISHGFTCISHPEPPSHLPSHPIPLGHPSAPALSTCLMHQTWTGGLLHNW